MAYLNLQNKALRQGMYLAYVQLPNSPVIFTTNGHLMVRGKVYEVKPLMAQDDKRDDKNVITLTDKRWLEELKDMQPVNAEAMLDSDTTATDEYVTGGGNKYQKIYVQYVMARYPVAEWMQATNKLVALDTGGKIIAVIAPINPIKEEKIERKVIETEERGNA